MHGVVAVDCPVRSVGPSASRGLDSLQHTSAPSRQGMVKFKYLRIHDLGQNKYLQNQILHLSLCYLVQICLQYSCDKKMHISISSAGTFMHA